MQIKETVCEKKAETGLRQFKVFSVKTSEVWLLSEVFYWGGVWFSSYLCIMKDCVMIQGQHFSQSLR